MRTLVIVLGVAAMFLWGCLLRQPATEPAVAAVSSGDELTSPLPQTPSAAPVMVAAPRERSVKIPNGAKPARMFRDPEMKEVMKDEAKSASIRAAAALMSSGLAKHLQLSDLQSAALQELLVQKSSIVWEQILLPMAAGDLDQSGMPAAGRAVKEAFAANAQQISALLGEEGFEVYQWYEKTQPDRDRVDQLNSQFLKAGQSLSEEQRNQLLAVMIESRPSFPWQHDFANPEKIDYERWHDYFTEENFNVYFQEMGQFNDYIVQRAQALLTPEQNTLLDTLLKDHVRKSKFTVRTTMALMGQQR